MAPLLVAESSIQVAERCVKCLVILFVTFYIRQRGRGVRPGRFSLAIDGSEFRAATVLLVSGGMFPQPGNLVVYRLSGATPAVAWYQRQGNSVSLANGSGESYDIDLQAEPGRLLWVWPVMLGRLDFRRNW